MHESLKKKLQVVGELREDYLKKLNLNTEQRTVYKDDRGLRKHIKKKRPSEVHYVDRINEIITKPDFIGINPREASDESLELVKKFDDNVAVGIKLDKTNNYLYVATLYVIKDRTIQTRLKSGRLNPLKARKIRKCG